MTSSRHILPPRRLWTEGELEVLRMRFAHEPTRALAETLGRPETAVAQKAYTLGLAKAADYLNSPACGRMRAASGLGAATRFQKGQEPPNKGLRGRRGWAPGRMADRQFRPGNVPHTWQPVGTLRIASDGYLAKKVTDEGPSKKRWERVHRLIWMEANGPIPDGHVVVFKPGRFTTDEALISLDALEQLTRAQHMARNTYHRYPKPIAQLIQLRGALQRQINKRAKHENENHRPA